MTRRPGEELLTFVFVGGGYAGLEALAELQDFAAEAIETYPRARLHGMRWILVEAMDRVLPEIDPRLADYAAARAARARHRHPARDDARGGDGHLGADLDRRDASARGPSSGPPAWSRIPSARNLGLPLDERGRIVVDDHLRVQRRGRRLGARRRRRGPRPGEARPALPAHLAARDPAGKDGRAATSPRRSASGEPAPFTYKTLGAVREPRPLQGGGEGGAVHASAASRPGGWRARTT